MVIIRIRLLLVLIHQYNHNNKFKLSYKFMILNYLEDIITSLDPTYIRVGNGMRLQRIAKLYELNCLIHYIANVP